MTKTIVLVTTFSICLSGAAVAASYKLDDKGKCHDEHGKFAKQALCDVHTYKQDAKGKCRDERGKFADGKFCRA